MGNWEIGKLECCKIRAQGQEVVFKYFFGPGTGGGGGGARGLGSLFWIFFFLGGGEAARRALHLHPGRDEVVCKSKQGLSSRG